MDIIVEMKEIEKTFPNNIKALRKAKLNLFSVKRGSGSWLSSTREPHTIPFAVTGKCGSVRITLMPAPVGKGLVIEKECKKILQLAGIRDIWSKTTGKTNTKINLVTACVDALKKLNLVKISKKKEAEMSIMTGSKRSD
jgi:small subunit ribosomal protein S5